MEEHGRTQKITVKSREITKNLHGTDNHGRTRKITVKSQKITEHVMEKQNNMENHGKLREKKNGNVTEKGEHLFKQGKSVKLYRK